MLGTSFYSYEFLLYTREIWERYIIDQSISEIEVEYHSVDIILLQNGWEIAEIVL